MSMTDKGFPRIGMNMQEADQNLATGLQKYEGFDGFMIRKESMPYKFIDLQFQVEQFLKNGATPEQTFDLMKETYSGNSVEFYRILNFSVAEAALRLEMEKKGVNFQGELIA
jgi:hypothetical protein